MPVGGFVRKRFNIQGESFPGDGCHEAFHFPISGTAVHTAGAPGLSCIGNPQGTMEAGIRSLSPVAATGFRFGRVPGNPLQPLHRDNLQFACKTFPGRRNLPVCREADRTAACVRPAGGFPLRPFPRIADFQRIEVRHNERMLRTAFPSVSVSFSAEARFNGRLSGIVYFPHRKRGMIRPVADVPQRYVFCRVPFT